MTGCPCAIDKRDGPGVPNAAPARTLGPAVPDRQCTLAGDGDAWLAPPLQVVFKTDAQGRWAELSPAWTAVTGHDVASSLGRSFLEDVHPDDRARHAAAGQPLVSYGASCRCPDQDRCCRYEIRYVTRDGSVRWMDVFAHATLDSRGAVVGVSGALTDISARRHDQERLRLAAHVFDGTSEGVLITDAQARIVDVNDAFVALTGYSREQVIGRYPSMLSSGRQDAAFYDAMWRELQATGRWSGEIWNRRCDGQLVAEWLRIGAVHSRCGELTHYVALFSDLTAQKRQQEQLKWLAHHDALTGLPNREAALQRLDAALRGIPGPAATLAVCLLDLDGFKLVNDRLGHAQGDALLVAVSGRIRQALRAQDMLARIGGDEFLLLIPDVKGAAALGPMLEWMLREVARPYTPELPISGVTASLGVAFFPGQGVTAEQLLRAADHAMYGAKQAGRNRVCIAGERVERSLEQQALLEELQRAMAEEQLQLYFQPKVCTLTQRVLGAEVLLRWQHPRRGLLSPQAFLPAVLGTPLEVELDLWVVERAVAQLGQWRRAGRTLGLSINVSPATLLLPAMADTIARLVHEGSGHSGVPLEGIELEVLETAAVKDITSASQAIRACARHGITFALDDFGTGYSSLSCLRQLPVHTLKIDRSFVGSMLDNSSDLHIVRAVIGLAQAFGMDTVAEGVETQQHAQALAAMGCRQLQGYGIAMPMSAVELQAWLDARELALGYPAAGTDPGVAAQPRGHDPSGG